MPTCSSCSSAAKLCERTPLRRAQSAGAVLCASRDVEPSSGSTAGMPSTPLASLASGLGSTHPTLPAVHESEPCEASLVNLPAAAAAARSPSWHYAAPAAGSSPSGLSGQQEVVHRQSAMRSKINSGPGKRAGAALYHVEAAATEGVKAAFVQAVSALASAQKHLEGLTHSQLGRLGSFKAMVGSLKAASMLRGEGSHSCSSEEGVSGEAVVANDRALGGAGKPWAVGRPHSRLLTCFVCSGVTDEDL